MTPIEYTKALFIIEEGDILLFRGKGFVSMLIGKAGESKYSHVGIASWVNKERGLLECVEFREGSPLGLLWNSNAVGGGRSVSLYHEVNKHSGLIDVYRPVNYFASYDFDPIKYEIQLNRIKFEPYKVTHTMRQMTGLPYGWRRIWWIAKHKLAGLRLFYNMEDLTDDTLKEVIYPVCSTAIAYAFSLHGYDLVKNKSDSWTEPSDIARSGRLNYLFTLIP